MIVAILCRNLKGNWWATVGENGYTKQIDLEESKVLDWVERAKARGYVVNFRDDPYKLINNKKESR